MASGSEALAGDRGRGDDPPRLKITEARLAETEFVTDRGRRQLPAWRLVVDGALGLIWTLDPAVEIWQPAKDAGGAPPQVQPPGQDPGARVDVEADDRSVLVHWLGASPNFERYESAEVVESERAFAIVPSGTDIGPSGWRTLVGHVHHVPARLQAPLGARVFVDIHGHAGQVVTASAAA